ncbi:ABC-type amino acid transport substrate-binding protein [Labrenzia sp. MBR-25]|jgi:ABC-type amino acid transport substrate-binding protein
MITRRFFLSACIAGLPTMKVVPAMAKAGQPAVLNSALQIDAPPYAYLDKNVMAMRGVLIDLLNILDDPRIGSFLHRGYPWARAQSMVAAGAADVFCCQVTDERHSYAYFAPTPIAVYASRRLFFSKDNPNAGAISMARSIEDLYGFTTVDLIGDSRADEIWRSHPNRTLVAETESVISMLRARHADFALADPLTIQFKMRELGYQETLSSASGSHICGQHPEGIHFGLRKTFPDAQALVEKVDEKIRTTLSSNLRQQVMARYVTKIT